MTRGKCGDSRELHSGSEMLHQRSLSLTWSRKGDKGCRSVQRGCLSGEGRGKLEESGYSVLEGRSWVQRGREAWSWRWKSTRSDPKGTLFGRSREWSKANSKGGRVARLGQDHGEGTHSPRRPLEPAKPNSSFQAICESEAAALQAPRASRPPPPHVTSAQPRPTSLPLLGQGQRRLGGRGKEPEPEPRKDQPPPRRDWILGTSFPSTANKHWSRARHAGSCSPEAVCVAANICPVQNTAVKLSSLLRSLGFFSVLLLRWWPSIEALYFI